MKGPLILAILLVTVGGALYWLLRPSQRDLEVLEERIAERLDAAEEALLRATQALDQLRALKPNVVVLDRELQSLRRTLDDQRRRLDTFRGERPEPSAPRAPFVTARRDAAREAEELGRRCEDLRLRVDRLVAFSRDIQPLVRRMLTRFGELYELQDALAANGRLDDALRQKIQYLREDVRQKRSLARTAFDTAARDAEQGRVLTETVHREVQSLLDEIEALLSRLRASHVKSS